MVEMTTKDYTYELPNTGCLLGMAYQAEVGRLTNALRAARLDISASEYLILRILFEKTEIRQCEITRILGKDKASVSRSLKSLVKKDLVITRQVSYKCCIASLTEEGKQLKPEILNVAREMHNNLTERISRDQLTTLRTILKKIIEQDSKS